MKYIGDFFGIIMYWCYLLVHDYGWTIILFTLLTKVVMLPISIMVQKNSIKMVKMYPEINRIKARCMGNRDLIDEEQVKLYKKENYHPLVDLIPVILQLVILMGVVNAIYEPLHQLLRMDSGIIAQMTDAYVTLSGANPESGSLQVQLVSYISDAANLESFKALLPDLSEQISQACSINLHFLGFDLGLVPWEAKGSSLLMPILAALSAWFMCFCQNKSNVLQSEQGKVNQYTTLGISVALSLYLGLFVPAGVGFYWILSNLMSTAQMYILNVCINPKKYIDYEDLEESRKELAKATEAIADTEENQEYKAREKADYKAFKKYPAKQLVFYSEKNGFYKYYKDVIETILKKTDIVIHYITSDPEDEIFKLTSDNFKTYYISSNKFIMLSMEMDADIVVMTMPDLQNYQVKRSIVRKDIEYIYMDHAVASANLTLRKHALDNFDTIFATNELMKLEMRKMEEVYGLKEKTIVEYGYNLIDNMIANYEAGEHVSDEKTVLIAPSWQEGNILDSCVEQMLDGMLGNGYKVIVRPHPQYVRHCKARLLDLQEKYKDHSDFELQMDFSSNSTVFNADVLVTDWSGIAYEYSFTTLKPTLFINTPMKIMNPDYKEIDIVPFDIEIRDKVGISVETDDLDNIGEVVDRLFTEEIYAPESLKLVREQYLYNVGKSARVGADYIIKRLIEYSKK